MDNQRINIILNAITAFAAILAAFAAFWAIRAENKRAQRASSVDLLLRFETQYHSKEMQRVRRETARGFLNATLADEGKYLLGFFETMGVLARRDAIDEYFLWHSFWGDVDYYYSAIKPAIEEGQKINPAVYADLSYLHGRLVAIEEREGKSYEPPRRDSLLSFLEEESKVGLDADRSMGVLQQLFGD